MKQYSGYTDFKDSDFVRTDDEIMKQKFRIAWNTDHTASQAQQDWASSFLAKNIAPSLDSNMDWLKREDEKDVKLSSYDTLDRVRSIYKYGWESLLDPRLNAINAAKTTQEKFALMQKQIGESQKEFDAFKALADKTTERLKDFRKGEAPIFTEEELWALSLEEINSLPTQTIMLSLQKAQDKRGGTFAKKPSFWSTFVSGDTDTVDLEDLRKDRESDIRLDWKEHLEALRDEREARGLSRDVSEAEYGTYDSDGNAIVKRGEYGSIHVDTEKNTTFVVNNNEVGNETEYVTALRNRAANRVAIKNYTNELYTKTPRALAAIQKASRLFSEEGNRIIDFVSEDPSNIERVQNALLELRNRNPEEARRLVPVINSFMPRIGIGEEVLQAFGEGLEMQFVDAFRAIQHFGERGWKDSKEYQASRDTEAFLRSAFQKRTAEHGFAGNLALDLARNAPQFASSIAIMLATKKLGAAGKLGTAARIARTGQGLQVANLSLAAAEQFERAVADAGGSVTTPDFFWGKFALGATYGAIEFTQAIHPFEDITKMKTAEAVAKCFSSFSNFAKTGGLIVAKANAEAFEELLQEGVSIIAESLGMNDSGEEIIDQALDRMPRSYIESWRMMLVHATLGTGYQSITTRRNYGLNARQAAENLELYKNFLNNYMLNNPSQGPNLEAAKKQAAEAYGKNFGSIAVAWRNGGLSRNDRIDSLVRRYKMKTEDAILADTVLTEMYNSLGNDEDAKKAFFAGGHERTSAELLGQVLQNVRIENNDDGSQTIEGNLGKSNKHLRINVQSSGAMEIDVENSADVTSIVNALNNENTQNRANANLQTMADENGTPFDPIKGPFTKESFAALPVERRKAIVKAAELKKLGGTFNQYVELIDENGNVVEGSVDQISAMQQVRMAADMQIDVSSMPQTVFHEMMHNVLKMVDVAAPKELKEMLATAFPAVSNTEFVNEEFLADAFRDYLSQKVKLVEEHKTAFDRLIEWIKSFFVDIDQAKTRALLVRDVQNAQDVVFNMAISGDFSQIDGLSFLRRIIPHNVEAAEPKPLELSDVFLENENAVEIPIQNLVSMKQDEPEASINNAAFYINEAREGKRDKRAPIAVVRNLDENGNPDGTYTVVDGNATTHALARMWLPNIRAVVVGDNTGTRLRNSAYLVKTESAGIDADGYLRTHGLDGLKGDAAVDKVYQQAEENIPTLTRLLEETGKNIGADVMMRPAGKDGRALKNRERVIEKMNNDYDGDVSRVVDLIGGTLVMPDTGDYSEAIKYIRKNAAAMGVEIAKVKMLNKDPSKKGYHDIKVSIRFKNGGIGEVIVVEKYINDAKFKRGGHIIYEIQRVLAPYKGKGDIEFDAAYDALKELTDAVYDRGTTAPDARSFASIKSRAVSSLTRLQGAKTSDFTEVQPGKLVKSLSSELHKAVPPSVSSYAIPASSFIQKDISKSPFNERITNAENDVKARSSIGGNPSFTEEEDKIRSRYTNADGTMKPGYMKAPNGKPTNLTEKQWLQVRTPAFKQWFGDWESVSFLNLIKNLPVVSATAEDSVETEKELEEIFSSLGVIENVSTGDFATFPNATVGKIFRHKGLNVLKFARILGDVFAGSIRVLSEDENLLPGHKQHRNIKEYHHYINKISVDGTVYYVRFTAREEFVKKSNRKGRNEIHNTAISDVSIYEENGTSLGRFQGSNLGVKDRVPFVDTKIQKLYDSVNNVSKVVDENGEPLVVYHGTTSEFYAFDKTKIGSATDNGWYGRGFYFSRLEEIAKSYGDTHGYFLNIRNPFKGTYDDDVAEKIVHKIRKIDAEIFLEEVESDGIFRAAEHNYYGDGNATELVTNIVKEMGYDGSYHNGEYIAFNPTQIKSATDNIGTFDGTNPDIRYSIGINESQDALASLANNADYGTINGTNGAISYPMGRTGKKGFGFLHIVEHRMLKDGATIDDAVNTAMRVAYAAAEGDETKSIKNTKHFDLNGARAIVAYKPNENPIITGYEISEGEHQRANLSADDYALTPLNFREQVVASLNKAIVANSAATNNSHYSIIGEKGVRNLADAQRVTADLEVARKMERAKRSELSREAEERSGESVAQMDEAVEAYERFSLNASSNGSIITAEDNHYVRTDDFRRLQEESRRMPHQSQNGSGGSRTLSNEGRERIKGVLRREMDTRRSSGRGGSWVSVILDNNTPIYKGVDGNTFRDFFEIARFYTSNGELVDLHSVDTTDDEIGYNDCLNYLSEDGLSGFSITPSGDLISVFNCKDINGQGGFLSAISSIVKKDAKTLDCYASEKQNLMQMYEKKFGFKTASVMDYNMDYDHDDIAKNHGMPQVAFMVNTDDAVETKHFTKDQYDEAVAHRDGYVEKDERFSIVAKARFISNNEPFSIDALYKKINDDWEKYSETKLGISLSEIPNVSAECRVMRNSIGPVDPAEYTGNEYYVSFLANDKLIGRKRSAQDYERLKSALNANIDEDKANEQANKILQRTSVTKVLDSARQGSRIAMLAAKAAELDMTKTFNTVMLQAVRSGAKLGASAQNAYHKAIKRIMNDAPMMDLNDMVQDTGASITKTIIDLLPEHFGAEFSNGTNQKEEDNPKEDPPGATDDFIGPTLDEKVAHEEWVRIHETRGRNYRRVLELAKAHALEHRLNVERIQKKLAEKKQAQAALVEIAEEESSEEQNRMEAEVDAGPIDSIPKEVFDACGINLNDAFQFAAFIRMWVADYLSRKNGISVDEVFKDVQHMTTYRKTVKAQLRDISRAILDPTMDTAARNVERMIGDIGENLTVDRIELRCASILSTIQHNAVRQSRKKLIAEMEAMIEKAAIHGKKLDAMERDMKRKIKGEYEARARYIKKVINLSSGGVERENKALDDIIEQRTKVYSKADAEYGIATTDLDNDVRIHRALEKKAVLAQYGGLKYQLPSYIAAELKNLEKWLSEESIKHEQRWQKWHATNEYVRDAFMAALTQREPNQTREDMGAFGRLDNALVASIRQRLERMLVGADKELYKQALEHVVFTIADGSEKLYSLKRKYDEQLVAAMQNAVAGTNLSVRDLIELLDTEVPATLRNALITEEQRPKMTWNNVMQLYASLLQTATYAENIMLHKREQHAALIKAEAHPSLLTLVHNLREIYNERREELSEAVEAVTGLPVRNPDPMYMRVEMFRGMQEGTETIIIANNPLSASLTPRIKNSLDFDLTKTLMGTFLSASDVSARAISFGMRGMALKSMLTNKKLLDKMALIHGKQRVRGLVSHLTDVLNGGYSIDDSRDFLTGLQKLDHATTYIALAANIPSAAKQTTGMAAFVDLFPNGFAGLFKAFFSADREFIKEICATDGFVARYGDTSFGKLFLNSFKDPRKNLLQQLLQASMTPIQIGDYLATIRVAAAIYKARVEELIAREPTRPVAAIKAQAQTETWAIVDEKQQAQRLENMSAVLRRLGSIGKATTKFVSSPYQQVAAEMHHFEIWRQAHAMGNYKKAREARKKFVNVVLANHVIMPVAQMLISSMFDTLLGEEPPEDDEIYGTLLLNIIMGPFSSILFYGGIAQSIGSRILHEAGLKPTAYTRDAFASQATFTRLVENGIITMSDLFNAEWEGVRDDMIILLGQLTPIVRQGSKFVMNRFAGGYDIYAERRKRRAAARKKEEAED